jgi:hypothetical protein
VLAANEGRHEPCVALLLHQLHGVLPHDGRRVIESGARPRECLADRHEARLREERRVDHQRDGAAGGKRLHAAAQRRGERGVVARHVVRVAVRIAEQPIGAARARERHLARAVLQLRALRGRLSIARELEARGRGPANFPRGGADGTKARDRSIDRRVGCAALQGHIDERHARLFHERAEHAKRLLALARRLADGAHEVVGRGAPILVLPEEAAHAVAELVRAEPALEHRDHRGAFLVGDAVERALDVGLHHHGVTDPARAGEAVRADGALARKADRLAVVPLGAQLRDDLLRDPGGECLVQPDVVPPRERDEVAEPHVPDLVGRRARVAALEDGRLLARVGEHDARGVGDEAHVLHGAEPDRLRNHQRIELLERIRPPEILLEQLQDPRRHHARIARLRPAALGRDVAKRRVVHARSPAVDDVERAHRERDEVAGKRFRRREVVSLPALAVHHIRSEDLGRVAHHLIVAGRIDRHAPWRLESRLVEARDRAARRDGLELRDHVPVAAFLLAEKPARRNRFEGPAIAQGHHGAPRGESRPALRLDPQVLLAHGGRGRIDAGAFLLHLRRLDREVRRVQPKHRHGALHLDLDPHLAAERGLAGIDGDVPIVRDGLRGIAQAETGFLCARTQAHRQHHCGHPGALHRSFHRPSTFEGRKNTKLVIPA